MSRLRVLVRKVFRLKNPRDKVIALCQESKQTKATVLYRGSKATKVLGVSKAFNFRWYKKAKKLALNDPWATTYIVGTLQNAKKRGLLCVVTLKGKQLIVLDINSAIVEIKALGKGLKKTPE